MEIKRHEEKEVTYMSNRSGHRPKKEIKIQEILDISQKALLTGKIWTLY